MALKLTSRIARRLLLRPSAFARDQKGATVVEFGLLAVPFFAIVGAIMESSITFLAGQVLDSATQDMSRLIRTGQAQNGSPVMTLADFRQGICDRLYNLFNDCDGLFIDVSVANTFQAANVTPPVDDGCDEDCDWTRNSAWNAGQSSDVVLVQVYYRWPVLLNLGGFSLANLPDGTRLLGTATVFRNEPF